MDKHPYNPASKTEGKKTSTDGSLDHSLCVELCDLIEQLTHSGQPSLDSARMKKMKTICKRSDEYVQYAYDQIMNQLEKEHAEIRLSAFQISDELFNRSHEFRNLLLAHFQDYMELTIESNPDFPLPPPKTAANTLKKTAVEAIHKWNEKYGKDYKKLSLGYNFLKNCKKLDFNGVEVRTQAQQRHTEEQAQRQETMRKQRLDNVLKEIAESTLEVKDILLQVENCLKLLLPNPESFQIHGLMSPEYISPDQNPFKSYTQRTPADPAARACRKSSDPSKIKNRTLACNAASAFPAFNDHPDSSQACSVPSHETESVQVKQESLGVLQHRPLSPQRRDVDAITSKNYLVPTETDNPVIKSEIPIMTSSSGISEADEKGIFQVKRESESDKILCHENDVDEDDFKEISGSSSSEDEGDLSEEDVVRSYGLGTQQYRISIEINTEDISIEETGDNTDLINSLKDSNRHVSKKFLPRVQRWLEVLSKTGANESDLRRAIDMKTALQKAMKRVSQLKIKPRRLGRKSSLKDGDDDGDDGEEDFLDVPDKEDYEEDIPEHLREEFGPKPKTVHAPTPQQWQPVVLKMNKKKRPEELDPTTSEATLFRVMEQYKEKHRSKFTPPPWPNKPLSSKSMTVVKREAPVVPFGTDLLHWGEKTPEKPLVVRYESNHRFWTAPFEDDDIVDKVALESMTSRTINFTGKFEPVKWACRAPLQNGKLCPRRDRVKCPFHGKIIARDNMGQPTNLKDSETLKKEEAKKRLKEPAEWEDPQLQAEIEAATGVKLNPGNARSGGQRGRKRKYPGLTNIKKVADTSKGRLERKVLSPKALRRVEAQAQGLADKRFKDKFGNNFNYAMN